jgi:hypothetical protein
MFGVIRGEPMFNLHENYDKLTDKEREFVDEQFTRMFQQGRTEGIALFGMTMPNVR